MRKIVLLGLIVVLVGAVTTASASALTGTYLTLSSQPGDPLLDGAQLTFSSGDSSFTQQYDGSMLTVSISSASNGLWQVNLAAPPGSPLAAGTYTDAVRAAFRGPGQPGIDVFGNGAGCDRTSGSFTVDRAVYGPNNYVQTFAATFTQFCDDATVPLTGEISVENPPPPPPLGLTLSVDRKGSVSVVSGLTTVTGTVSCSEPVTVFLNGNVAQRVNRFAQAQSSFGGSLSCTSDSSVVWSESATSFNTVAFGPGRAEVSVTASATDPAFGGPVTQQQRATIVLTG